jgi:CHAD domain-containing protein
MVGRYAEHMVDVEIDSGARVTAGAPATPGAPADRRLPAEAPGPSTTAVGLLEPLPAGLQRICIDRLDRAIRGLTTQKDRSTGVHTARKSMKRIRAMLRFVRDTVGYPVYRNENVVLRDAARRIAPVRDGAVLVETIDAIVERHRSGLAPHCFAEVRRRLEDRHRRIARRVLDDRQLMSEVVTTLRVSRARFASWPQDAAAATPTRCLVPDDFDAIAGGLHRVYRRGRNRMGDAYAARTTAAFHEWRKRVKYLRYQMEALEPLWPDQLGAYARALDQLGESLGGEHDLAVLEQTLAVEPQLCPDRDERRLLDALILHERAALRHGARRAGRLAFAEEPDDFVRRLGAYWQVARDT